MFIGGLLVAESFYHEISKEGNRFVSPGRQIILLENSWFERLAVARFGDTAEEERFHNESRKRVKEEKGKETILEQSSN